MKNGQKIITNDLDTSLHLIYGTMFAKYLIRYLSPNILYDICQLAGWLANPFFCSNITSPFPLRPDNKGRLRSSKEKLIERPLPDRNLVYLELSQFTPDRNLDRNIVFLELSQFTPGRNLDRNLVYLKLSHFTPGTAYTSHRAKWPGNSWARKNI